MLLTSEEPLLAPKEHLNQRFSQPHRNPSLAIKNPLKYHVYLACERWCSAWPQMISTPDRHLSEMKERRPVCSEIETAGRHSASACFELSTPTCTGELTCTSAPNIAQPPTSTHKHTAKHAHSLCRQINPSSALGSYFHTRVCKLLAC